MLDELRRVVREGLRVELAVHDSVFDDGSCSRAAITVTPCKCARNPILGAILFDIGHCQIRGCGAVVGDFNRCFGKATAQPIRQGGAQRMLHAGVTLQLNEM